MTAHALPGEKRKVFDLWHERLHHQAGKQDQLRELINRFTSIVQQDVTQKFLQAVPVALQQLEAAYQEGNAEALKRIAHNFKTTISVMGLNDSLNPLLDEEEAGGNDLRHTLTETDGTCNHAMVEAKQFHASLLSYNFPTFTQ